MVRGECGGKRKQSNDDSNKTQEAGRQLTEKQQSWKRLKWTLDSNSVCAAAQVVLRLLPETFERTQRHRARQRETDRQLDEGCTLLQQLQKRSFNFKIVCLQFQYEPSKRVHMPAAAANTRVQGTGVGESEQELEQQSEAES